MLFKNVRLFLSVCVLLSISFGCKKNDSKAGDGTFKCASCTTTPQALAANNSSSKGIYKGVLIGSTGTIIFDVLNSGSTITAKMVLDGVNIDLTSSVTWQSGQTFVSNFTGPYNGSTISISFSVDATGGSPSVSTSNIPRHPNASFTIVKETSNSLIECFEGSYHTTYPEDGTFNMILSRSAKIWGVAHRKVGDSHSETDSGTLTAEGKIIDKNGNAVGSLAADTMAGSYTDNNHVTITFTGKRTL